MQCIDSLSLLLQKYVRKGIDAHIFFVTERTKLNPTHAYYIKQIRVNVE